MEGEIAGLSQSESNSSQVKVLDVIPVQLVEDDDDEHYGPLRTIENSTRSKYYKQTYRRAWEQMPDFAGWLTGVDDEPTRAFCIYCQKTLHAHRLSLLKHTCTMRHQKAAQLHRIRMMRPRKDQHSKGENASVNENEYHEEDDEEMVEYSDILEEGERPQHEVYQIEDEEEEEPEDTEEIHLIEENVPTAAVGVPPISTQVIDAVRGCPVSGLAISLYKLIEGKWTYINEGFTNHTGRFSKFVEGTTFTSGRYKLHYDVDKYFESKKQPSLYPFIEIVFDCKGLNSVYHIPLILSPNGYSTYKGSP